MTKGASVNSMNEADTLVKECEMYKLRYVGEGFLNQAPLWFLGSYQPLSSFVWLYLGCDVQEDTPVSLLLNHK